MGQDTLKYATYHGQERARHFSDLLDYDVVFTTYGTVAKEMKAKERMKSRDILYRIAWFRIVLDEGVLWVPVITRCLN